MSLPHLARPGCIACLLLGLSVWNLAAQPAPPVPAEDMAPQPADFERLAEVFATPGTPSIKGKAWVAVNTGPTNFRSELHGWLIEDSPKEITLFAWDGELHKLRKPKPDEKRPELKKKITLEMFLSKGQGVNFSVAWEVRPEDFAARGRQFLADGRPKDMEGPSRIMLEIFAHKAHILDAARFAHCAHQLGQQAQATVFYTEARKAQKYTQGRYPGVERFDSLHLFVAHEIATVQRSNALSAGRDGESRRDLQKRWEKIAALPHHRYRGEARELVKHYQDLLEEDRRWVEPDARALAAMTTEQQTAYWLYHLRDLDFGQGCDAGISSTGRPVFILEPKKPTKPKPPNAVVELKKLGLAAVPRLIAHLDDSRPTRCNGPYGQHLLRYGDCCQRLFESITGHSIYMGQYSSSYPIADGQGKECKARAERWWQNYQKKGEKQMLVDGTAAGDRDSAGHARRLAEKYPDAALAPIIQGARASKDASVRGNLVQTADQLKDSNVAAFLREELDGPFLDSRIKAAKGLIDRGESAGVRGLHREWKRLLTEDETSLAHSRNIDELIRMLIHTGDPATLRLLSNDMPQHPVSTRSTIIRELLRLEKFLGNKPLTREALVAVEDLLVKSLADREQELSLSGRGNGKSVSDPMLADLAAEALAWRWKQADLFDITGPLQVRERQRVEVKNVWLRKRGQEPLPVPTHRVKPAPEARVSPLVKAVLEASTPAERQQALKEIEELGLPALPAVRNLLGSLQADHPAHGAAQILAGRLALTVREARFTDDSVKPSAALCRKLEALQSRPITEKAFMDLLQGFSRELPDGVRGVKIALERLPDDSGVYLAVTLIADRPARKGLSPQLSSGSRVEVGEKSLGGGFTCHAGFGGKGVRLAEIDWSDLVKNLRIALEAKVDEYLLVQAHCAEER
jgi:hypothetical protein